MQFKLNEEFKKWLNGFSIQSWLFRYFIFDNEKNRDLTDTGKHVKRPWNYFDFNNIDIINKTPSMKQLLYEMNVKDFIDIKLEPKSILHNKLFKTELIKMILGANAQLRSVMHKNYGLRCYQLPNLTTPKITRDMYGMLAFWRSAYGTFQLVPFNKEAIQRFEKHPQYTNVNMGTLQYRQKEMIKRFNKIETDARIKKEDIQEALKETEKILVSNSNKTKPKGVS